MGSHNDTLASWLIFGGSIVSCLELLAYTQIRFFYLSPFRDGERSASPVKQTVLYADEA